MNTDLAHYQSATQMAETFADATAKIRDAVAVLSEQSDRLTATFFSTYDFGISVGVAGDRSPASDATADKIVDYMQRRAWAALLTKLEIEKVMSSKRRDEMRKALDLGRPTYRVDNDDPLTLPPITPQSIMDVMSGFIGSAEEFFEESIQEEYRYLRPYHDEHQYKSNSTFAVNQRIVLRWAVDRGWNGGFRPRHTAQPHLTALDNIFHRLDGKGVMVEHYGPLCAAIETSGNAGTGETEFFRFRCFKNSNLHLTFKRKDLLDEFNRRGGGGTLGNDKKTNRGGAAATPPQPIRIAQ